MSDVISLSVILCTHNPTASKLQLVLESLRQQTLPPKKWELILVDNLSVPKVEPDVSWHVNYTRVEEKQPGLFFARKCGFEKATAEFLVCVDDDNVLDLDYLEKVIITAKQYPFLGVFGGNVIHRYTDIVPSKKVRKYVSLLGFKETSRDIYSNLKFNYETMPIGAGMVIRKSITTRYYSQTQNSDLRKLLGRNKLNLSSCEDYDLAMFAVDLGYGVGVIKSLRLTHLISQNRLSQTYLATLQRSISKSIAILEYLHHKKSVSESGTKAFLKRIVYYLPLFDCQMKRMKDEGLREARKLLQKY